MNRMLRRSLAGAVMAAAAFAASRAAADLTGKWHVSPVGSLDRFIDVVQTGNTVTFTFTFNSQPFGFTGTVNGADYTVYAEPMFCAALLGSVLPSDKTFDGNLIAGTPPTCYPYSTSEFAATRCTCFDGNTISGDGCSADCQVEPCFTCTGDPSVCTPAADGAACDDGSVCTTGETCGAGVCGGGSPVVPCVDLTGAWHLHTVGTDFFDNPVVTDANETITQRGPDVIFAYGDGTPTYVGTIDPATGTLDVRTANHCVGNLGFDPLSGTVASDGNSFSATGYLLGSETLECQLLDTFVMTGTRSTCGNGVIENGEGCDDGNEVAGDGCDADCQIETCRVCSGAPSVCTPAPSGTSCPGSDACMTKACDGNGACAVASTADCDDGHACTIDSCDPIAGCMHTPKVQACRSAGRSTLELTASGAAGMDALTWNWSRGESTSQADFADPRAAATYTFCLFAGTSSALIAEAVIAPDAQRWTQTGSTGFTFRDRSGAADGVRRVRLESSMANRTSILLGAKAGDLARASLPLAEPITAQLENSAASLCWGASYAGSDIIRDGPTKLKAKFRSR
jgi:cysteine-rich repeat protein